MDNLLKISSADEGSDSDQMDVGVITGECPSQGRAGTMRGDRGKGKRLTDSEQAISLIELRVGKIVDCVMHPDPDANNLVVASIDLGEKQGDHRSAITTMYRTAVTANRFIVQPEGGMDLSLAQNCSALVGKSVVVLCNIKKRKFLGLDSDAMILFSKNESSLNFSPIFAPSEAPLGTIITFPGYSSKPTESSNKAAKAWRQIEIDRSLFVDSKGIVCFDPLNIATRLQAQDYENEKAKLELVTNHTFADVPPSITNRNVSTDLVDGNRVKSSRFIPLTVFFSDDDIDDELSLNNSDVNKDARNRGVVCTSSVIGNVL